MSVGTTRIIGKAGPIIDLAMFLATDLSELQGSLKIEAPKWVYGTGEGAVDVIYAETITLDDAGAKTLDLYASSGVDLLLDIFQQALTMKALKFLYLKNNSADATLLVLGTETTAIPICVDPVDVIKIPPKGSSVLWNDPSAAGLVISVNKDLLLTHGGQGEDSMDVDIVAMGLD